MNRNIKNITQEEIDKVNEIVKNEYNYSSPMLSYSSMLYQCFTKTNAIYSGIGIIKIYKYLCSIGIDIMRNENHE